MDGKESRTYTASRRGAAGSAAFKMSALTYSARAPVPPWEGCVHTQTDPHGVIEHENAIHNRCEIEHDNATTIFSRRLSTMETIRAHRRAPSADGKARAAAKRAELAGP